jgi:hypothetical protein
MIVTSPYVQSIELLAELEVARVVNLREADNQEGYQPAPHSMTSSLNTRFCSAKFLSALRTALR